ncbi:TVP38/TMEM64 family protein [Paenisporosarcina cavernae]|uniref:TVP38/TMEM64 family membrane protein n=1 Tax=Paenisporosarcina cavernae TaxID=2320858 RepID=A0A385YZH4_9BACL|nr:TVP38/TMEM64 family protein [Paenisporosarcina cavernae]AYC30762.1 TVP38/TMEM64 family protein [Paenisporosarcina cavernae]
MDWLTTENLLELTKEYRALGPIIGFLLPFLEAFIPFLPLFIFVFANASAYGLWLGFLISWAGVVTGSYAVFLIVRKYGRARFMRVLVRHERVQKLIHWIEVHGFGPLFLLLCFPFTPSAIVNVVAGLSDMRKNTYLWTLLAGKFVMIFTISFVGYDIRALITQPIRTAIVVIVVILLWFVGKQVENRLNKQVEADFREIQKESEARKEQE